MGGSRKIAIWVVVVGALAALAGSVLLISIKKRRPIIVQGVVLRQDADVRKQLPIAGVTIAAANGLALQNSTSDAAGFFQLTLRREAKKGEPVTLIFHDPEFRPLSLTTIAGNELPVIRLAPLHPEKQVAAQHPLVTITNISVRYSIQTAAADNIGSAVKVFEVNNKGNIPCNNTPPCSPDGKWKAAVGSASLDAGEGNEFRNVRASCIGGPCPFTRIENDHAAQGGRFIEVSALNWSDPATFLLEAEVFHSMTSDVIRHSYPIVLGRTLNFTLPADAEGPSIEAELDNASITFPLGPDPCLSWADCTVRTDQGQTKVYRCELKPGYQFR